MRAKLAVLGVVALVAATLVYWFGLRDRGPAPVPATASNADDPWAKPAARAPARASASGGRTGELPTLSFETDPDGPLLLEGQVLDEADRPVAGALVRISTSPPRTATTDADGSFSFDKLLGRTYALSARAGDKVGGPVRTKVVADAEPVVLRLRQGTALTVNVSDAVTKKPIAGAMVQLADADQPSQTTDGDGKVTFRGLDGGWTAVVATARGYGPATGNKVLGRADRAVTIELAMRAGAPLSGKVVDEQGRAIAGARVWAVDAANRFGARGLDQTAVTSAADGGFTIPALAAGSYVLRAEDERHAPAATAPVTTTGEAPTAGVEVVMKSAAALAGVVVDGRDQPVPYATVRLSSREWSVDMVNRQAAADDQGRFELRALPRAAFKVRAESEEAASKVVDVDLAATAERRDVTLVLDQTGLIAGLVVDDTGEPVAEAEVSAMPDFMADRSSMEDFMLVQRAAATTDGGGRFVLRGLQDGPYRLSASRSSGGRTAQARQGGVAARTGDQEVRIVLPAPGGVKGTIELPDGEAPGLAMVSAGFQYRVTVRGGAFELTDVVPGTYDLRVSGAEFADKTVRNLVVEAGKMTDAGTIKVRPGRKIRGRVVDGKGQPVEGAKVVFGKILIGDGSSIGGADEEGAAQMGMRTASTDPDGRFVLGGVSRGAGSLLASHRDRGRSLPQEVLGGEGDVEDVTLTLRGYGSIAGTVTRRGEPVAGATITASPLGTGGQAIFVSAGNDGTFVIDKVPEGPTHLTAMKTSIMSFQGSGRTVTVIAGQRADGSIVVPAGDIALTVEVQPEPGAVVNAAMVFLFEGKAAPANAKETLDAFYANKGAQGAQTDVEIAMTRPAAWLFWLGTPAAQPTFKELLPGSYTTCVVPLTGALGDATFGRVMNNLDKLASICQPVAVAPAPAAQKVSVATPSMRPLPEDDD